MRRSKIAAVAALMAVGLVSACGSTTSSESPSGAAAAEHGMRDVETPDDAARRTIDKLTRRKER